VKERPLFIVDERVGGVAEGIDTETADRERATRL
jgi:hypothetical protein